MEIQERFDRLQDKITHLQNVINKEPQNDIMQNNNINNNYIYHSKFNNNTYNSRFAKNNIILNK